MFGSNVLAPFGVDLRVGQSQADLLRRLHDALVGIVQGLDELLIETTVGVMYDIVSLAPMLLEDIGMIMQ